MAGDESNDLQNVVDKLLAIFEDDEEETATFLIDLLATELHENNNRKGPKLISLTACLNNDAAFKRLALRIARQNQAAGGNNNGNAERQREVETRLETVIKKIYKLFQNYEDGDKIYTDVTLMLTMEFRVSFESGQEAPNLTALWVVRDSDAPFRAMVLRIYDSVIEARRNDPNYRAMEDEIKRLVLVPSKEGFALCKHKQDHNMWGRDQLVSGLLGFARGYIRLPPQTQTQIITYGKEIIQLMPTTFLSSLIPSNARALAINVADDLVPKVCTKIGGATVMVALAATMLAYDVVRNIFEWRKGQISGKRCLKNIIDSGVIIASGTAGGIGGAALGTLVAGPVGGVIGGIIGGVLASQLSQGLIDSLTQDLFDLPPDVAVENAYNFLGVSPSAPNNEINRNYRRLALEHHPDRGGNQDEFIKLQVMMEVIRASRAG